MIQQMIRATCCVALAIFATTSVRAANTNSSNESFNPDVSLILSGTYANLSADPDNYTISGISLAEETGPGSRGFSIAESELVMSANIDDRFFGRFTAALTPENTVEVEEAFVQTLGLPGGWSIKAGRMLSGIGYQNSRHSHTWEFVDTPLVYRALLGNRLADDGIQFTILAPTEHFLEIGGELLRGDGFPAGGAPDQGTGTRTLFARTGGDVGVSNSWRLGLSYVQATAAGRESGDETNPDRFDGTSNIAGMDFVWKWAQGGNWTKRNLVLVAELLQRSENGQFTPGGGPAAAYRGTQTGGYVHAVYGFRPHWRFGARYDWLNIDNTGALDPAGHAPTRSSVMVDYARSEFSRIRLQYNYDLSSPTADSQVYLQYVMSLGAHGAHSY
jgi:hypothetical protein